MDYRKPTKKVIVEVVSDVLKERGSVDTQTKLHKKVLQKLKKEDKTYRLSAERMRIVSILSKKIKVNIRTRSVGAAPKPDENDFKKQGLGYDPVVKRWRRIKPGDDLSGHHHHRGEFASPGQPCPVCTSPLKKVHNATLYGGVVAIGFRCGICTYLTGHRWREPSRYSFKLKGGK
mgnify:FL=1|jgi:hypothetical protein|tara:strand:- start:2954 stop:3478 length:525 start_codon:yes stop_codon:yes gene_type:complete